MAVLIVVVGDAFDLWQAPRYLKSYDPDFVPDDPVARVVSRAERSSPTIPATACAFPTSRPHLSVGSGNRPCDHCALTADPIAPSPRTPSRSRLCLDDDAR
jgi:hypothetical protein